MEIFFDKRVRYCWRVVFAVWTSGPDGEKHRVRAPSKMAINNRQVAFDGLSPSVIRSRNVLKAWGASKEVLADAETSVRKLTGARKSKIVKDDPNTPANEADNQHSASQMSFDNRLGKVSLRSKSRVGRFR